MGDALERLLTFRHAEDCYAAPPTDLATLQLEAMNERLRERLDSIPLVKYRAENARIQAVRDFRDVVPLLLPHTAYKSYPESLLVKEKWDRLTQWLRSVSAYPLDDLDLAAVKDVDDWIARLDAAGHPVSCSSGTTGKAAMLIASRADTERAAEDSVRACAWATRTRPARDRRVFALAPVAAVPRNFAIMRGLREGFGKPDVPLFTYPVPPITIGAITRMVALRKSVVDGTALPAQIAAYEKTTEERTRAVEGALTITADALVQARGEKLYLIGLWGDLYKVAAAVRERGFGAKDFHSENMVYVGGGLKRAQLPANYREYVCETFNISPERNFQFYGMQELNSIAPRCPRGGYHIPPWVVCLPLDKGGETLLPMTGEVEGRAAFFDLSLDGRWGGVISGDRIEVDFGGCACGARTPAIRDAIVRYADLEGDDKINCSGTVDAYVRGMA